MPAAAFTTARRLRGAALLLLPLAWAGLPPGFAAPPPPDAVILRPPPWVHGAPAPPAVLQPSTLPLLFARLAAGDRQWLPSTRRLADGRLLVSVRRRVGDPPLAAADLEAMLRQPPRWERERAVISRLLAQLRALGVTVVFARLISPQALGQWTPQQRRLSLQPDLPEQGTRLFAQVLNHEAIHVAQSCAAGAATARPRLLGLGGSLTPSQRRLLQHPLYRRSLGVQAVEREALAHQADLSLGVALLERHCGVPAGSPGRLAG